MGNKSWGGGLGLPWQSLLWCEFIAHLHGLGVYPPRKFLELVLSVYAYTKTRGVWGCSPWKFGNVDTLRAFLVQPDKVSTRSAQCLGTLFFWRGGGGGGGG